MDLHEHQTFRAESSSSWSTVPEATGTFRSLAPGELLAFPVPTMALQLDALLRHLEVDGEFSDWPSATIHLAQARAMWTRLEPALAARVAQRSQLRHARRTAADMGKALNRAAAALKSGKGVRLVTESRQAIALVAVVERAFE